MSKNLFKQLQFVSAIYRVRYFRRMVSNFDQSEARKHCFLASDWLEYEIETLLALSKLSIIIEYAKTEFTTFSELSFHRALSSQLLDFLVRC